MRSEELAISTLLLDPNNYRLQDEVGFRPASYERYHLEQVQKATFLRLKSSGIKELHDSIVANGFLPIERIVVTPYLNDDAPGFYLVIEGNRRVAALRQIAEEVAGGVEIPSKVEAVLQAVPCVVVDEGDGGEYFKEALMGVRHVGGIKEWGGYQRAKLIADMRDLYDLSANDISAKIGLSVREVNRRYRAFKALEQMKDDDEFGDLADPTLYPIFHEAIAGAEIRSWLGWNADTNKFDDADGLAIFYSLITSPDGVEGNPKLKGYSDVRQLKNVLPNPDARRILFDPERPFLDSLTIVDRQELSRKWRDELAEAAASLNSIGAIEVKNFTLEDVQILDRLAESVRAVKEVYEAVQKS